MAVPGKKKEFVSVEEYYRIEETALERSDYYKGEMFCRAGGTTDHARIGTNLIGMLGVALRGKTCEPFNQDQRIKSEDTGLRIYPDASVFCEVMIYDEEDINKHTAINPAALFEVLSAGTEAYDRGFKFAFFRQCESLQAYVLIAQDRPHVEVFLRNQEGRWELFEATGTDQSITIPCLDLSLDLAELYDRVSFPFSPKPVSS